MSNLRNIQFLRSSQVYRNAQEAKDAIALQVNTLLDGSPVIGRYEYGSGATKTIATIVGIAHVGLSGQTGVTFLESANDVSSAIEQLQTEMTNVESSVGLDADGNKIQSSSHITSGASTIEAEIAALAAVLEALNSDKTTNESEVISRVFENEGLVSAETKNLSSIKLGGYVKSSSKGDINSGDTIATAFSKIENKLSESGYTIANEDGSINVIENGADINVNIKSGEKVIMKSGDNGLWTDIKISSVTPSDTTVKEQYALLASDGTTHLGDDIKIYKDSSLVSMELVSGGTAEAPKQYLRYTYIDNSGNTQTTDVDVSLLLAENEFKSGLTATASGVVTGVVDPSSEEVIINYNTNQTAKVLYVGANGFGVNNIQAAIDAAVEKEEDRATSAEEAFDDILGSVKASGSETRTWTKSGVHYVGSGVTVKDDIVTLDSKLAEVSGNSITYVTSSDNSIVYNVTTNSNGSKSVDLGVNLDTTTQGTGEEHDGTNALTITNDGLFLSTNWNCGTF